MSAFVSEYLAVSEKLDEARDRIAELEAEVARLKQPAHVLAEAERLLRSAGIDHVSIMYWDKGASETLTAVIYCGTKSERVGTGTLAEAYAKLKGGCDV